MARCSNRSPQGSRPLPDSGCETGRRPISERPAPAGCPFLLAGGTRRGGVHRTAPGRADPQQLLRPEPLSCPWPRARAWSRALELLLVDPDRGMNLRNDVCHGLVDTLPKHRVALILQASLYLLSHAHGHRSPAPPTPSRFSKRTPQEKQAARPRLAAERLSTADRTPRSDQRTGRAPLRTSPAPAHHPDRRTRRPGEVARRSGRHQCRQDAQRLQLHSRTSARWPARLSRRPCALATGTVTVRARVTGGTGASAVGRLAHRPRSGCGRRGAP